MDLDLGTVEKLEEISEMIKTREELRDYINSDNAWYCPNSRKQRLIDGFTSHNGYILKKYLTLLRKSEYHLNNSAGSRYHTYLSWYYEGRKNRLGRMLGIEIYPNCFGKGLAIWHASGIVVHPEVRVGENCLLHGGNCIGNKGLIDVVPQIGNNVEIGYGACIIGDVTISDNTVIGANTVVAKAITEPGTTVVGNPARKIR